ncbi:MAG: tol-pal system YbgF family protein [Acidimicrobiia bacterium]
MSDTAVARTRLEERLAQARSDVSELASQVAAGEIDSKTAGRLEAGYRQEIEDLEAELDGLSDDTSRGRSPRRVVAGTLLFLGAVVVIVMLAAQFVSPRDQGVATGLAAEAVDPETISDEALEAVIATNADHPQINGMRMALADRYFVAGDFRAALPHYQAVLESDPDSPEGPIALARVGWMFYQSGGEPEVAVDYLTESLARAPAYDEAKLYLAAIYLYGVEDRPSALALLAELAEQPDLPPDIRSVVEEVMADAQVAP